MAPPPRVTKVIPPKVIGIVGAGISGATFALQLLSHPLLRQKFIPILLDRAPGLVGEATAPPPTDNDNKPTTKDRLEAKPLYGGPGLRITANGLYPLYRLDLAEELNEKSTELQGVSLWRALDYTKPECGERLGDVQACSDAVVGTGAREIERGELQKILVNAFKKQGGDVRWDAEVKGIRQEDVEWVDQSDPGEQKAITQRATQEDIKDITKGHTEKGPPKVEDAEGEIDLHQPRGRGKGYGKTFLELDDGKEIPVDMVVGADGQNSLVRWSILKGRGYQGQKLKLKYTPGWTGQCGFQGISSCLNFNPGGDKSEEGYSVNVLMHQGSLSSAPLPGGKVSWSLTLSQGMPPGVEGYEPPSSRTDETLNGPRESEVTPAWASAILPSLYPRRDSIDMLMKNLNLFHPFHGSLRELLTHSESIMHTPLRQASWTMHEIYLGQSMVTIGDASRVLLPSSNQATSFAIEDATILARQLLLSVTETQSGVKDTSNRERTLTANALSRYAKQRAYRSDFMVKASAKASTFGFGRSWCDKYFTLLGPVTIANKLGVQMLGGHRKSQNLRPSAGTPQWPYNYQIDVDVSNMSGSTNGARNRRKKLSQTVALIAAKSERDKARAEQSNKPNNFNNVVNEFEAKPRNVPRRIKLRKGKVDQSLKTSPIIRFLTLDRNAQLAKKEEGMSFKYIVVSSWSSFPGGNARGVVHGDIQNVSGVVTEKASEVGRDEEQEVSKGWINEGVVKGESNEATHEKDNYQARS